MNRIGLATGYDPNQDVRAFADTMRLIDERGWEIGFFSETFHLMRDSVTALAAFALATRRLTIGCTQVVRLRSAVTMAQTVASLDELSGGRVVLCPGACTANHAERFGLTPVDPPLALREWVEAIRLVLTGEKVSYKGSTLSFDDVRLSFTPVRRQVPLWIAATTATGLRVAGALGDGVLLNTVASPEYAAAAIRIVRESVEAAGKDWASFEVAQLINTSMDDDRPAALEAVRWEVATKFRPSASRWQARARMRVGEPHIHDEDLPAFAAAWERGGMDALTRAIPDRYVETLTASGTPEEVVRRVQAYRDAGVKLPIVRPAAAHQTKRVIDLLS